MSQLVSTSEPTEQADLSGPPPANRHRLPDERSAAERDRELAEALSRDWDKERSPKSAAKLTPVFGLEPKDQLLFQWERASSYSASLASHPDRFYQLMENAKAG